MFKNYLKIAWRNIWSNKIFTSINIISLSIGLSTSFVIGALVYYDFSFDTFHKDSDRIYRITSESSAPDFLSYTRGVPVPLMKKVTEDMDGVEQASCFFNVAIERVNTLENNTIYKKVRDVVYTDKNYFKLFKYEWIAGSPDQVLENPNEVILTKSRAQKYFPNYTTDQIIGKTVVYNDSIYASVTGIVEDFKKRTDFLTKEFISLKTAVKSTQRGRILNESWTRLNSGNQLFIKLYKNANKKTIKNELDDIAIKFSDPKLSAYNHTRRFNLQLLNDIHFNSNYGTFDDGGPTASKTSLYGLAGIGLFILILACINFINLNTARATKRAKEIGVFKTLGANKKQVVIQILGEMFLLTFMATILSVFLAALLVRIFEDFTPPGVTFQLFTDSKVIVFMLILFIAITFLSGFYPALIIAKFKPTTILKTQISSSKQSVLLRKYLTVFQFTIAQVFILGTLLVGKQIHFLMNKDMGFKKDAVAYVNLPWNDQKFANTLNSIPGVNNISLAEGPPASKGSVSSNLTYRDGEKEISKEAQFIRGDLNYLKLYDIDLLAGRERLNDSIKEYIINETYLKALGFKDPNQVLGKWLHEGNEQVQIVGVMKDFNQRSLKSSINPMILAGDIYKPRFSIFNTVHFSITEDTEQWKSILQNIETAYKKLYPDKDYNLTFVDDTIAQFYNEEQKLGTLLNWAMGLSILISCLGLFGLVIHTTQTRTKEIGIRKVLGQESLQITLMLSKDFMKLVIVAVLIGIPIAYLLFNDWLSEFSYKTVVNPSYYIIAAGLTFIIALLTVSSQTIIASKQNPAETLKEE